MSFFRKKRIEPEEESIPINKTVEKDCPPLFQSTGLCTCMTCPRLNACHVEKISRGLKCVRPIRACSLKAYEKGEPPVCSDLLLEEFFDYINGKYLRL